MEAKTISKVYNSKVYNINKKIKDKNFAYSLKYKQININEMRYN